MTKGDFLPKAYNALLSWLVNFSGCLSTNFQRFGISEAALADLNVQIEAFRLAHEKVEHPNAGKTDRLDRKEKAAVVSKTVRNFVNTHLRYNEAVSNEDRMELGLNIPDTHPTPTPPPATYPVLFADISIILRVTLNIRDMDKLSRGKPAGVHGCEIRWAILDAPPAQTDALTHSAFSVKATHTFEFEEHQRGQRLYFRGRWESNRGEKGPWGEIGNTVIP